MRIASYVLFGIFTGLLVSVVSADEPTWLGGKDLERARMLGISADWLDAPLRRQLDKLARQQKIAVFIDRRIDTNREATFSVQNATWDQLAWALADQYEIGVCRLEDVYYFGPIETCRALPVLYETLRKQVIANRKQQKVAWLKPTRPKWPRLSEPSSLLQLLAKNNGLELAGSNAIEFDIWPEQGLPAISTLQQIVLLTVGFDRWIEISSDGRKVTLVPFPKVENGTVTIRNVDQARQMILQIADDFPTCNLKALGRSIVVQGPTVEIARLQKQLAQLQSAVVGDSTRHRFSMVDTKAKRGVILASVARTLELELSYPPESRQTLDEVIEISVRDVTAEEVLSNVLAGTKLTYEISNQQLLISTR